MFDLFVSEFKRYRLIAALFAITQICLWVFLSKLQMVLLPSSEKHAALTLIALLSGVIFSMVSIGLHKRKNNWTYLVHRPLAINKIHLSISAAGLSLLFVAINLPFLLTLISLDLFTDNVVEMRHYLYSLHLFLISTCAYFLGQFAMLHPNKITFSALWVLSYIILRNHTPPSYELAVDTVIACLSALVAHHAFKVNLSSYSTKTPVIVASVLLLQPAILIGFMMLQAVYYHIPMNILGLSPLTQKPDGNLPNNFLVYKRQELPLMAQQLLTLSTHSEAKSITRQLNLSEFEALDRNRLLVPYKNSLFMNDHSRNFMLVDQESNSFWVFSHEGMVFVGRSFQTEKEIGFLGKDGFIDLNTTINTSDQFTNIALPINKKYIQTKNQLFRVDFANKKLVIKHQLPDNEFYKTKPNYAFDFVSLMSNKATYLFNKTKFHNTNDLATPMHSISHPSAVHDDLSVDITEVSHGFVALHTSYHMGDIEQPGAALTYVPHEGETELLVTHDFTEALYPNLITQQKFMFSPILMNMIDNTVASAIHFTHEPPKLHGYIWQRNIPKSVMIFCLLAAVISAIATWVFATKMKLSASNKTLWVTINLICALPGLVAFLILNNWRLLLNSKSTTAEQGGSPC